MPKSRTHRTRPYTDRTTPEPVRFEVSRADSRPRPGNPPLEPHLGPYEFRYPTELGYSSPAHAPHPA